jgi:hypothetical protein
MSSKLPVPSRAALTALQGLIAGTTCTLVLVTEDRRRRINAARHVLDNADKLKSNKRYYRGGAAAILAVEEEAQFEPEMLAWTKNQTVEGWPSKSSLLSGSKKDGLLSAQDFEHQFAGVRPPAPSITSTKATGKAARAKIPPPIPKLTLTAASLKKVLPESRLTSAERSEILLPKATFATFARIRRLCESTSPENVETAAEILIQYLWRKDQIAAARDRYLAISALVCSSCLKAGRGQAAAHLLRLILAKGPIDYAVYSQHEPLAIIASILPDGPAPSGRSETELHNLELAFDVYLPKLTPESHIAADQAFGDMGKRLLELALSHGLLERGDDLLRRTIAYTEIDFALVRWYIKAAFEKYKYKQVIQLFRWAFANGGFRDESDAEVIDLTVNAITMGHGFKAQETLRLLSKGGITLRTGWITKLLNAHWRRSGSFAKTFAEFEALESRLDTLLPATTQLYRNMIGLSLQAGDDVVADQLYARMMSRNKGSSDDFALRSLLIRLKARAGKWTAVHAEFVALRKKLGKTSCGKIFVGVLKQYARQHTLEETELFLKNYVETGLIGITPHLVGIMLRQYGEKGDLKSFLQWLEYCAHALVRLDATFSNAVLTSCRDRWQFYPSEMRVIARKLYGLNPGLVNNNTRRILMQAAESTGRSGIAYSLRKRRPDLTDMNHLSVSSDTIANEKDIYLAMSHALIVGRPDATVAMYKEATGLGMRKARGLHLAVSACIQRDATVQSPEAMALLRDAQQAGCDISTAVGPLIDKCFSVLGSRDDLNSGNVMPEIQALLRRFEDHGIEITSFMLLRASRLLLRKRQARGALRFALAASQLSSDPQPVCSNVFSFGAVLLPYAALNNAKAIISTTSAALNSPYAAYPKCLKALKDARRLLRRWHESAEIAEAHQVLTDAISVVRSKRAKLKSMKAVVSSEVMRIVQDATLNAAGSVFSPDQTASFRRLKLQRPDEVLDLEPFIRPESPDYMQEDWAGSQVLEYEQPSTLITAQ